MKPTCRQNDGYTLSARLCNWHGPEGGVMKKPEPDWLVYLITGIVLALCGLVLFLVWEANQDCKAAGGIYVRTLYGMECILK